MWRDFAVAAGLLALATAMVAIGIRRNRRWQQYDISPEIDVIFKRNKERT